MNIPYVRTKLAIKEYAMRKNCNFIKVDEEDWQWKLWKCIFRS